VVASRGPRPIQMDRAGLNPLHCGAVVASGKRTDLDVYAEGSQSPSLRGSGRFTSAKGGGLSEAELVSQSPSLRGSGRFIGEACRRRPAAARLNPLHCGAVVASFRIREMVNGRHNVSIPFIAGQWSLPAARRARAKEEKNVSIPFIAGQWSLPKPGPRRKSRRGSLNPLHCGAVVASRARDAERRAARLVSIPFIAGQWSLHKLPASG